MLTPRKRTPKETPQHILPWEDKQTYISHDLLFKEPIQNLFEHFIELFFPKFHTNIDFPIVKILSEEMIFNAFTGRKHIVDILIEVEWKETDAFILICLEPQRYQ